jgi:thioredoxin reductase
MADKELRGSGDLRLRLMSHSIRHEQQGDIALMNGVAGFAAVAQAVQNMLWDGVNHERRDDMSDGTSEVFDVIYPVLGCDVRSDLGKTLGARHSDTGYLEVDAHQQTSVTGLYAIGDVVSDLHQIAVATGHAAIAATHIHNSLPRNLR